MPPTANRQPLTALAHPRHWPTWLAVGVLRLAVLLPYPALLWLGRHVGAFAKLLPLSFVRTARRNLELCFPELSRAERERLLLRHFHSVGIGIFEAAISWWWAPERIARLIRFEGDEHIRAALARGKGVIILAAHFTTMEICGFAISAQVPINIMYRPSKNPVLERFIAKIRNERAKRAITRDDIRGLIGALKNNECVWYAPDQSYRKKGAAMVPFFGIPAATNVATPRLARMTGATVLPFFPERLPDAQGYRMVIQPPLDDFPGEDQIADTKRLNERLEAHIRRVPEQYLWIHRRFKGLTGADADHYPSRSG